MIYGNVVGSAQEQLYILEDETGVQVVGVLSEQETVLDATENDIRAGKTAATELGVTEGTKEIPAYHTTEGTRFISEGKDLKITNLGNACEFTKLQALVCAYNTAASNSVAAEKVSINGKVYAVGSTDVLADVTVDTENQVVDLGIVNQGTSPCIIRFFTYKEEA